MRILITSMGSTAAQNLVWALRRDASGAAWFVVGADVRAVHGGVGLSDRDVVVPMGSDPAYVERLAEHVREHRIEVLVPVMPPELLAVAARRERFEALGAKVLVSSTETLERCLSKRALSEALAEVGAAQPEIVAPEEAASRLPLFARPDGGQGSVGAHRIDSPEELAAALAQEPAPVLTELATGVEHSVDVFAHPPGQLVSAVCRRREATKSGLAVSSETVALGEERRAALERSVAGLELHGFANLQFFAGEDGEDRWFDVNPRLGGAMVLSFSAGLDAPDLLRRFATGESAGAAPDKATTGLRLERRWHNVITRGERPPLRAVIFDLDDTLYPERAYALSGLEAVAAHLAREHGVTCAEAPLFAELARGRRGHIIDRALAALGADPALGPELVELYRSHRPTIELYDDVPPLLDRIAGKLRTGLISDGFLLGQQRKVEALGLAGRIEEIVLTDEGGKESWKPSPYGYRRIMETFDLPGEACLFVGDNPTKDFRTARALGWETLRVARPDRLYPHEARHAEDDADRVAADLVGLADELFQRT